VGERIRIPGDLSNEMIGGCLPVMLLIMALLNCPGANYRTFTDKINAFALMGCGAR
jgi:hypothetical protein